MLTRPFEAVSRHVNKAADVRPRRPGPALPPPRGSVPPCPGPPRPPGPLPRQGGGLPSHPLPGRPPPTSRRWRQSSAPGRAHPPPARAAARSRRWRCRPVLALRQRRGAGGPPPPRLPATGVRGGRLPAAPRPPPEEGPGPETRKGREAGEERNTLCGRTRARGPAASRDGTGGHGPAGWISGAPREKESAQGGTQALPGRGAGHSWGTSWSLHHPLVSRGALGQANKEGNGVGEQRPSAGAARGPATRVERCLVR